MYGREIRPTGLLLGLLLVLVLGALLLPRVPLADPLAINLDGRLLPPGAPGAALGTDHLGRDMLSRVLHGLSLTLSVSIAAVLSSYLLGVLLGALAGSSSPGLIDLTISWFSSLILSIPFLLLIVALMGLREANLVWAYAVLAGIIWIHPFRVVRGEVIRHRGRGYVLAARVLGYSRKWILWRKLVPRALTPALAVSYTYLPEVIALEAGLSFFGLGVQPPRPALGRMIYDGLPHLFTAPWLALVPAAVLFLVVLLINVSYLLARRETP